MLHMGAWIDVLLSNFLGIQDYIESSNFHEGCICNWQWKGFKNCYFLSGIGSWSEWTSWDSCNCKDIRKPQTRQKRCQSTSNTTLLLPNLQCQGFHKIQQKSCYGECRPYYGKFLDDENSTSISPDSNLKCRIFTT